MITYFLSGITWWHIGVDLVIDRQKITSKKIFSDYPLLFREQVSATRNAMKTFIRKQNLPSYKQMTLTSNEALKQAVIAGLGYSIMPSDLRTPYNKRISGSFRLKACPEPPTATLSGLSPRTSLLRPSPSWSTWKRTRPTSSMNHLIGLKPISVLLDVK
ncbi:LysR substrate-binding domain-containing protein [Aureitalea marina]|uniref:LysR substrate-binding domain-containing protein n=1 Tax=Aureitalea marina TaxID=930804 RepID=UPI0015E40B24|nr:LysR substrate-binding domain-containing protein [Aureitalea marina]